jgi:hypothetical protein
VLATIDPVPLARQNGRRNGHHGGEMEKKTLFDKLFLERSIHVEGLPPHEALARHGKAAGRALTAIVDMLRRPEITPNHRINKLAALVWELIGHDMIPSSLGAVSDVHFAAEITSEFQKAAIICPMDFAKSVKADVVYSMGAIVYVASQARDYFNGKFVRFHEATGKWLDCRREVTERARAYESEFLHTIESMATGYAFNDYQQKVMRGFPGGLASRPRLMYESKPFVVGKPLVKVPNPRNN